jgi:hypothetical protein
MGITRIASVRARLACSAVGGIVLVSPVLAFSMVIALEVVIDGLMEAGVTGVSAITIGAVGCALFRRILPSETAQPSRRSAGVRRPGTAKAPFGWLRGRHGARQATGTVPIWKQWLMVTAAVFLSPVFALFLA